MVDAEIPGSHCSPHLCVFAYRSVSELNSFISNVYHTQCRFSPVSAKMAFLMVKQSEKVRSKSLLDAGT